MFSIGTTEVLIILAVALLVIGPSKLPEVAKSLGKGMAEFKRMSSDVKKTIDWETQLEDEDLKFRDTSTEAQASSRRQDARAQYTEDSLRENPSLEEDVADQAPEVADSEDKKNA